MPGPRGGVENEEVKESRVGWINSAKKFMKLHRDLKELKAFKVVVDFFTRSCF